MSYNLPMDDDASGINDQYSEDKKPTPDENYDLPEDASDEDYEEDFEEDDEDVQEFKKSA